MVAIPDGSAGPRSDMGVAVPLEWVLVVADDAMDRWRLFRLLERHGYHATVADDVDAAVKLVRAEPFDLVLVDLVTPEPDVYTLLEQLKSDRLLHQIPVIVISAVADPKSVARCLHLGADDYLFKPGDPAVFGARIAASLERRRLREREADYVEAMGQLADAVAAVRTDTFDGSRLDPLASRPDPLGGLARAFQEIAAELDRLGRDTTG
jgi:DNA-binding response OmpR family regulator